MAWRGLRRCLAVAATKRTGSFFHTHFLAGPLPQRTYESARAEDDSGRATGDCSGAWSWASRRLPSGVGHTRTHGVVVGVMAGIGQRTARAFQTRATWRMSLATQVGWAASNARMVDLPAKLERCLGTDDGSAQPGAAARSPAPLRCLVSGNEPGTVSQESLVDTVYLRQVLASGAAVRGR
jgi:hypothetical protein